MSQTYITTKTQHKLSASNPCLYYTYSIIFYLINNNDQTSYILRFLKQICFVFNNICCHLPINYIISCHALVHYLSCMHIVNHIALIFQQQYPKTTNISIGNFPLDKFVPYSCSVHKKGYFILAS
jgi:hypothetical protein